MADESSLTRQLRAALATARTGDAARAAIASLQPQADTPHALRAALAIVLDGNFPEALTWPALQAAREAQAALDAALDRALIAALTHDPRAALAHELTQCGQDIGRARRAVEAAWKTLAPPSARAAATLIDLLRIDPLGPSQLAVYDALIAHGVDVRGPLTDDTTLGPAARTRVLSAQAARTADAGRLRPVAFEPDPLPALARALSDWTRHATHPRQLFYWFRTRAGLHDDRAYLAALDAMVRWPMAPEVRAQYEHERGGPPAEIFARALGAGRFECGRCGDRRLAAIGHRALDPNDPTQGLETEYRCPGCDLRYFSEWELATAGADPGAMPRAFATS